MDESMNSVHSISAMDISPASSPISATQFAPLNSSVLNAFQQQQQVLSTMLFSSTEKEEEQQRSIFPTTTTTNNNSIEPTNQLRQRIVSDPLASISETKIESISSNPKTKSTNKIFLLIIVVPFLIYFLGYFRSESPMIAPKSTIENVTDYLKEHLVGQEKGLRTFENALKKHKNFSVILIEGPVGVGKTYLASSMEKFLRTSLLSIDTLLGLSAHHWNEPSSLAFYLASHLVQTDLQFLILDDLDLLPSNETYCRTFVDALENLGENRNLFILILKSKNLSKFCEKYLRKILTETIPFEALRREHVRYCVQREAYLQNVQPDFTDEQIENILNSIVYFQDHGVSYASTGCKQISSLVMLESRKHFH